MYRHLLHRYLWADPLVEGLAEIEVVQDLAKMYPQLDPYERLDCPERDWQRLGWVCRCSHFESQV